MTDERRKQVETLFRQALEREPDERDAYLDEGCGGDEALRREVESLLEHAENAGSFIEEPAIGGTQLLVGRSLGSYRVLSPLGRGGMGEVWRARDSKLGREVTIKTLPEEFAKDEERLVWFEREARLLASLNHPNIAAIYGLEESEGTRFLVLELVEGDTLAEFLAAGPLPVESALNIALQVAEGLEAAHEKGIIHRDLKPANIKVTPDGKVKVLDFGLAKALRDAGPNVDLSKLPTISEIPTVEGQMMGTVGYMSPEQVRGDRLDKRTDTWAFGCVLYEMLAGSAAFASTSVQDTLAAVLRGESDWNRLPRDMPEAIRRLLRRCLEKDARRRLQAIGDARVEIEELLSGESEEKPAIVATASARKWLLPWSVAAVLLIAVVVLLWTRDQPQPQSPARLDLVLPAEAPMAPSGRLALSPDGRRLVYRAQVGGGTQLYLRDMDTGEAQAIPGTSGGVRPFFSPNGESLGFFAGGKLRKVLLAGGEPVVLADASVGVGGAWAPDDTIYFNTQEGEGLSRVPAIEGQAQRVTQAMDWWPDILPGREALLFTGYGAARGFGTGIHSLSLTDGQVRKLLAPAYYARYVPTGHLVYAERGKLLAVAFDLDELEVTSQPVTLLEDLRTNGEFWGAPFALSEDGLLVYAPGPDQEFASLVWADHQGKFEPLGLEPGFFGGFALSPNGAQVAVTIREGSGADIWLWNIARGQSTRFTHGLRDSLRAHSGTP